MYPFASASNLHSSDDHGFGVDVAVMVGLDIGVIDELAVGIEVEVGVKVGVSVEAGGGDSTVSSPISSFFPLPPNAYTK